MKKNIRQLFLWIFITLPIYVIAETGYVVDKLMVGLHQDKMVDSTIIKLVPTGTTLEILKRDGDLSHVKDPEGISGWIDNSYLTDTPPAQTLLIEAQNKTNQLAKELQEAKRKIAGLSTEESNRIKQVTTSDSEATAALLKENSELKQKFKSEKLKAGEMQAQLAELRNQMSSISTDIAMAEKIEHLNKEKSELEDELRNLKSGNTNPNIESSISITNFDFRNVLIIIGITLLIGLVTGAFLLDLYNRRRHGGFRI